jgi:catechol 2,3-dioxygenase-like lactoylglutathione lyase family enzyme
MAVVALDHIQLAMPRGREDDARGFFVDLLGFVEEPKPAALRDTGGLWLRAGAVRVHLGVEEPFRPAAKAHPCFAVDDLDAMEASLEERRIRVRHDDRIPGVRRFFAEDVFGNRLEFQQA